MLAILQHCRFLSTLSLRRATQARNIVDTAIRISIHALLAESDAVADLGKGYIRISIHALLAESDSLGLLGWLRVLISIHALLAESDPLTSRAKAISTISIHALLAESDGIGLVFMWWGVRFLSTLSLRRATG